MKKTAALLSTTLLFGGGTILVDKSRNPYTDTPSRLEIIKQSSLPESGTHKVSAHKDRPAVTMNKWNDEAGITVSYDKIQANGSRQFLTDRIEWKAAKEELHAYPLEPKEGMEDGGYEIEVYLKEKPETNVFNFTIEGAEELDFFYQPELTPEEIAEGASRPENVIGSYAVYHKTKANHIEGQTNYATGKAFHIYRPKAIDANGSEVWAELSYSNGTLTVTVPQDFLDDAVYPVRVDPTFGYSTRGASSSSLGSGQLAGSVFTSPTDANGTVSQIQSELSNLCGAGCTAKAVITNNSKVIISGGVSSPSSAGCSSCTSSYSSPPTISATTDYFLTIVTNDGGWSLHYDAGTTDQGIIDTTNSHSSPTNPTDAAANNNKYSIYATYTASGAGDSTPTATQININGANITSDGGSILIQ